MLNQNNPTYGHIVSSCNCNGWSVNSVVRINIDLHCSNAQVSQQISFYPHVFVCALCRTVYLCASPVIKYHFLVVIKKSKCLKFSGKGFFEPGFRETILKTRQVTKNFGCRDRRGVKSWSCTKKMTSPLCLLFSSDGTKKWLPLWCIWKHRWWLIAVS